MDSFKCSSCGCCGSCKACSRTLQIQDSTRQDYDPSISTCSLQVHRCCSACTTATAGLDHPTSVPSHHHSLRSNTSDLFATSTCGFERLRSQADAFSVTT